MPTAARAVFCHAAVNTCARCRNHCPVSLYPTEHRASRSTILRFKGSRAPPRQVNSESRSSDHGADQHPRTTIRSTSTLAFVAQVPDLADTLRADTADVLHGVAKHDMAEAIEHVVRGIGDVKEELHQAFLARDTGHTGALGGSAFKVRGSSWERVHGARGKLPLAVANTHKHLPS